MNGNGEKRVDAANKPRYDQRLVRLIPCPFCGSSEYLAGNFHPKVKGCNDNHRYYIRCGKCGTCGPTDFDPDKVDELWNQRQPNDQIHPR